MIRPWVVRRACLDRVGPLDEAFRPTEWDEADLAFRIREAGWKVATCGYERLGAYFHLGQHDDWRAVGAVSRAVLRTAGCSTQRWDAAIARHAAAPAPHVAAAGDDRRLGCATAAGSAPARGLRAGPGMSRTAEATHRGGVQPTCRSAPRWSPGCGSCRSSLRPCRRRGSTASGSRRASGSPTRAWRISACSVTCRGSSPKRTVAAIAAASASLLSTAFGGVRAVAVIYGYCAIADSGWFTSVDCCTSTPASAATCSGRS